MGQIKDYVKKVIAVGADFLIGTDSVNTDLTKNFTMDTIKAFVNYTESKIIVAKEGGDFTSVKDALDSIIDNSVSKRYVVLVYAGIYEESNPIQGKEYVSLKAVGDLQTTRITALNPNTDLMIMTSLFTVKGFSLLGVTGATNYAVNQSVTGLTSITRCAFNDCSNGVLINNPNASMAINDCAVFNLTATTVKGVDCQSGSVNINTLTGALGNIDTLIEVTGINSKVAINNLRSAIPTLTTALSVKDLAQVDITGAELTNMVNGIEAEGGSHTHMTAVRITDATLDGIRINDVGTNTRIDINASVVENSARFDFNFLSATGVISGGVTTSLNKTNFVDGAGMYGTVVDLAEDDEGVNILGELHVGLPEKGAESAIGGGDSYTRGMMVYTESSVGAFVDVSVEAKSASTSSFTFPSNTLNNAIYLSSSLKTDIGSLVHYGFKTKVLSVASLGTGNIILEYWNGVSWIETNAMEVDSGGEYFPHAKNYFQHEGGHHIRYSQELVADHWTRNDPMSLGTDYFWVRMRITADITTAPIFEQFKLHTNRFEINADGWVEYFGKARPTSKLPWEVQVFEKATGTDVKDQDLYLSQGIDNGGKKNKFLHGITDPNKVQRIGFKTTLPLDMDTSTPIDFQWSIITDIADVGTIDWIIRWGYNSDGDSVYATSASAPAQALNEKTITLISAPPLTNNKSKWYKISLDVSDTISRRDSGFGDTIWVSIERSGLDTHTGNASLIAMGAYYTKWCEGGHTAI